MSIGLIVGIGVGVAAATPLTNMLIDNSNNSSSSSSAQATPGEGPSMNFKIGGLGISGTASQATGDVQASVGLDTIGYGVIAALIIAIIGSALPAYFITTIKPAEAMRNE
jgi:putative ABC transport system permease protein